MTDVSSNDSWPIEPRRADETGSDYIVRVVDAAANHIVALSAQLVEAQEQNRVLTARCDELAERLRARTHLADAMGCDCVPCVADRAALARVDAMGGEQQDAKTIPGCTATEPCELPAGVTLTEVPRPRHAWGDVLVCPNGCERAWLVQTEADR